jgi:calcineurin-like phosphoesterase family protein
MSHYAHRVWPHHHKGSIHLYGHSHSNLDDDWGKSMDVGVDAAYKRFGEYRPFSLDEVLKIMENKKIKIVDHHDNSRD